MARLRSKSHSSKRKKRRKNKRLQRIRIQSKETRQRQEDSKQKKRRFQTKARCLEPGKSYFVRAKFVDDLLFCNAYITMLALFLPLLANVAKKFGLIINAYAFLPNGYIFGVTLPSKQSDLPKAMTLLNLHLARLTNMILKRSGPLIKGKYKAVEIKSAAHAKLAYLKILTAFETNRFAKNKEHATATIPLNWIGTTEEVKFARPECISDRAQVGDDLALNFPLFPQLKDYSTSELQIELRKLLKRSQSMIQRHLRASSSNNSLALIELQNSPPPRNQYNKKRTKKTESFDYTQLLTNAELAEYKSAERNYELRMKAWKEAYCKALEQWTKGRRHVKFPLGTYKMRVLHKCKVSRRNTLAACRPPKVSTNGLPPPKVNKSD